MITALLNRTWLAILQDRFAYSINKKAYLLVSGLPSILWNQKALQMQKSTNSHFVYDTLQSTKNVCKKFTLFIRNQYFVKLQMSFGRLYNLFDPNFFWLIHCNLYLQNKIAWFNFVRNTFNFMYWFDLKNQWKLLIIRTFVSCSESMLVSCVWNSLEQWSLFSQISIYLEESTFKVFYAGHFHLSNVYGTLTSLSHWNVLCVGLALCNKTVINYLTIAWKLTKLNIFYWTFS